MFSTNSTVGQIHDAYTSLTTEEKKNEGSCGIPSSSCITSMDVMEIEDACEHTIESLDNALGAQYSVLPPMGYTPKVKVSEICQSECGSCII